MWLYALSVLARHVPGYRAKGVDLVHQIHDAFVVPGRGVVWKMKEDLGGPYPGYGFGALDAFDGYVSYRCLDERALAREIADMRVFINATAASLTITQDLGLGIMLWLTHFFSGRGLGRDATAAQPRRARSHVARRRLFLSRARSPLYKACLYQLRRFGWSASCASNDQTSAAAE
jgi:hypothetical protein